MSEEVKSASESKKEDWMNSKWRPMMGWMYMLVCTMDMVVFPILWSLLQTTTGTNITQWNPLTLQGAGLFHIAMGAVLGIAAFGRTQEKLGGANNGGIQAPGTGFAGGAPAFGAPSSGGFGAPSSFGSPAANSFGSQPLGSGSSFGGAPNSFGAQPRQPGNFNAPAAAMGGAAVGAAAGFAMAQDPAQPAPPMMIPPQPSRPPLEDDHPELE
jgi:hypothetical protein